MEHRAKGSISMESKKHWQQQANARMASKPCPEWSKPTIYQGGCGWSGLYIRPGFAQGRSLHPRSLSDHVSWPSLDPPTDRWLWYCQFR